MILSEKITELRKRSGLSQEEFGEKIGVSRQAVSKWEMAQTVPDVTKVVAMAEFFEVPVDFLLKDEYDLSSLSEKTSKPVQTGSDQNMVTLEEVQGYFQKLKNSAKKTVLAIMLFFISPMSGILLTLKEDDKLGVLGIVIQVIFLMAMAICIVLAIWPLKDYKRLRLPDVALAYGVKGVAQELKKNFEHAHLIGILLGVVLLVTSIIPMMVCSLFTESDMAIAFCNILMLFMIASGISSIVYVSLINGGYGRVIRIK